MVRVSSTAVSGVKSVLNRNDSGVGMNKNSAAASFSKLMQIRSNSGKNCYSMAEILLPLTF